MWKLAAVGALVLLGVPAVEAQAVAVETADGLRLDLSPSGRVTALTIGRTPLPMRGDGGFALADFANQPEPTNLVPNPGFEDGAQGWGLAAGQTLDTAIVHTGKASVRLEVPGPATGSSNVGCLVPAEPNTRYRVGLWLRRENVGVCGAYASERDDQGNLTGKQTQVGVAIPKQDGIWLPLSWEITTQPKTTRLSLRADIYRSTGTLWLDDFSIVEVTEGAYQPVSGKLERAGDRVTLRGAPPGMGLELEATLRGDKECVRVDGVVRDAGGKDRAVGVRFALPLDLTGWTWHTDAEEREPIAPLSPHRHTYDCESGIGRCSIYPWSALTGPPAGLSLALPLSQGSRVFILQHDQRAPETSLTFYFGLSAQATKNPSRAPFAFVIYRHDPAWGMRSAMERYYRLFPESFLKRPVYEGYLNYANLEPFDAATHRLVGWAGPTEDASDFGEGYRFLMHVHGCYDYRQIPSDDPKMPSDETVLSWLREMAEQEKTKPRYYVPTAETMEKLVYDADGHIRYIGDTRYWRAQEGYNRSDQPGWGLNFRVNEDPGVSSSLVEDTKRRLQEYAKDPMRRPFDATLTADGIEGYFGNTQGLDYRVEHLRSTELPLTFGKDSLKPAIPNTILDFHRQVWWPLSQEHQVVIYGNANGYEQIFALPFIDLPMVEWDWDREHPGRFERYLRATAHHKIWRFWRVCGRDEKDPPSVLQHFARGLASDVYPCVGALYESLGTLEPYRAQFRQYVPAMEELSLAGWEPVPHARASEGVVVERYGSYSAGELHLTLRNYADQPKQAVITLDRAALGIPKEAALLSEDILPGRPAFAPVGPELRLPVEANGARALWIGTREEAARHGLRLAAAALGKIDRLFSNELNDPGRQALARALAAARSGAQSGSARALAAAEELRKVAGEIEAAFATNAPVDRAKLLLRLRVAASYAPAALLGIESSVDRLREGALRGEATRVEWRVTNAGKLPLTALQARVLSPWAEVTGQCRASGCPADLPPGKSVALAADLFVPPEPPRVLMPYLLEIAGRAGAAPFAVAVPVDLTVVAPIEVAVLPKRVFRGTERPLTVTVTNRLSDAGSVRAAFAPPAKAKLTPAEIAVDVPGKGQVEQLVSLSLDKNTPIGELRLPYAVTGADARYNVRGSVALVVTDPVPQATARRLTTAPKIDGNLEAAEWPSPPTIADLRLLANGGPATEKTAVWAAYDAKGLHVAFRCAESQMAKLQAKLTDRGSPLYTEDDVEVFVLPPGAPQSFQLAVNALGTRSDNFGNKTDWAAAAQRLEDGWTVEILVPYAALGVTTPPRPGASWAIQFGRQQKPKAETTSWTPGQAFNVPEGFGELLFE